MTCEGNARPPLPAAGDGGDDAPAATPSWLPTWGLLLSVVISCMDRAAVVLRKPRSPRPRGTASRWWRGVKIPAPTPRAAPPSAVKRRHEAPLAAGPDDPAAAGADEEEEERPPAKRATRECYHCGVTATPLWRSGPMGFRTLCNACGIRFAESRRTEKRQRRRRSERTAATGASGGSGIGIPPPQQEMESQLPVSGLVAVPVVLSTRCGCNSCHLSAADALRATATTVAEEQPQQQEMRPVVSGSASPVPESLVRVPIGLDPTAHLSKKKKKKSPEQRVPQPPTTESSGPPPPPAPAQEKKKKKTAAVEKRPYRYRPRETGKRCLHCRSSSTPQWRGGPLGRSELCNACGVRYKQGGLVPEYRPLASPSFQPTEHSHLQWEVMHLHRRRKEGNRRSGHAEQPGGAAPDPIPLDDDDDEDEVAEPMPLEVRPPSPVHNDENLVLAIEYYHNHPAPPQEQQQPADGGGDDGEPMHVFQEQPTLLQNQQLPCPVDSLSGSDGVPVGGGIDDDLANACAHDNDDPMGDPSSSLDLDLDLDPFLLDGPAAPMLGDGDDAFFFFF